MDDDTTRRATPPPHDASPGPTADEAEVERLRHLAYLMDDMFRIPVINHRFGLDALMGLVPVVGDAAGFAVSGYLILRARRMGVPNHLLARMVARSAVDLAVGSVPLVGDVADFVIKPNRRSMRMLEHYLERRAKENAARP